MGWKSQVNLDDGLVKLTTGTDSYLRFIFLCNLWILKHNKEVEIERSP